jgi:hypothetical protein
MDDTYVRACHITSRSRCFILLAEGLSFFFLKTDSMDILLWRFPGSLRSGGLLASIDAPLLCSPLEDCVVSTAAEETI